MRASLHSGKPLARHAVAWLCVALFAGCAARPPRDSTASARTPPTASPRATANRSAPAPHRELEAWREERRALQELLDGLRADNQTLRAEQDRLRSDNRLLREENKGLREELRDVISAQRRLTQAESPSTPPRAKEEARPPGATEAVPGHWLSTATGVRHNQDCHYFQNSNGRACAPTEGKPCKVCGG